MLYKQLKLVIQYINFGIYLKLIYYNFLQQNKYQEFLFKLTPSIQYKKEILVKRDHPTLHGILQLQ